MEFGKFVSILLHALGKVGLEDSVLEGFFLCVRGGHDAGADSSGGGCGEAVGSALLHSMTTNCIYGLKHLPVRITSERFGEVELPQSN